MFDPDKLEVTAYARKLAVSTYRVTERFPRYELFGLTSQMRRAAVSVGSNIAEGCGRSTRKLFILSLDRSSGEAGELEYQCRVALDLEYGKARELRELRIEAERIKKMLARLMAFHRGLLPPKTLRGTRRSP